MGWFSSPLHQQTLTFTVTGRSEPDADGVPTTTPTQPLIVPGCNVQPVSTVQTVNGGLATTTGYRASLPGVGHAIPAGTPVTWPGHGDGWFVDGELLEFTGTGVLDHTEVTITRVGG